MEESDLLRRSVKKYKQQNKSEPMCDDGEGYIDGVQAISYMEVVSQGGRRGLFYMAAREVDGLQDDPEWFQMMEQANGHLSAYLNIAWPLVEVSLEEYRQLWEPW